MRINRAAPAFIEGKRQRLAARIFVPTDDAADLAGAILTRADLTGADLRHTKLGGLTQEQLDQACGENVKLDPPLTIKPCPK